MADGATATTVDELYALPPEDFTAARDAVRRADPEAEVSATDGQTLTPGTLGELSAPSLFSTTRCVVVRSLQ